MLLLYSSCIVMYVRITCSCIVRNDDVNFTRNKRVNEELCFVVLPGGSPISMHFMSTV